MSNPFVAFSEANSCSMCTPGKSWSGKYATKVSLNDDGREVACQNYDCPNTKGTVANEETYDCKCGSSDCSASTGFYCIVSDSKCSAGKPCESSNGSSNNNKDCKCGNSICVPSTGYFCTAEVSLCSTTCVAGKFRNSETTNCDVCAVGRYRSLDNDPPHTCIDCAAGKFNGNNDLDDSSKKFHLACEDCSVGLHSLKGASVCGNLLPECQSDTATNEIDPVDQCTCGGNTCTAITGLRCNVATSTCKCPAGRFFDSVEKMSCADCPAGTYSDKIGQDKASDCQPCEEGKYAPENGQTKCNFCSIGTEYKDAKTCEICTGGKFQPDAAPVSPQTKQVCSDCSSGQYNADQGEKRFADKHVKCDLCPDGLISVEGATYCVGCPIGYLTTKDVSLPCAECAPGTKGVQEGQTMTKCVSCGAGQYQKEPQQPFCVPCTAGQFTPELGQVGCANCPKGYYTDDAKQISCKICLGGEYQKLAGKTACLPCLPGKFGQDDRLDCETCAIGTASSVVGRDTPCPTCSTGRTPETRGSTACVDCLAGKFLEKVASSDEHICKPCGPGKYTDTSMAPSCKVCVLGTYQSGGGTTACLPCIPGEYQDEDGKSSCKSCAANTFNNDTKRQSQCNACPSGRKSSGGAAACSDCAAGKIENSVTNGCDNCGLGEYRGGTDNDVTTCKKCLPGSKNPTEGSGSCLPCIPGEFQDEQGQPSCKPCLTNEMSKHASSTK